MKSLRFLLSAGLLAAVASGIAFAAGDSPALQKRSAQNPELVRQVQEQLSASGHEPGPIDGLWGPRTRAGVMDFQRSNGIEATGQIDQETLVSLGVQADDSTSLGGTRPSDDSRPGTACRPRWSPCSRAHNVSRACA